MVSDDVVDFVNQVHVKCFASALRTRPKFAEVVKRQQQLLCTESVSETVYCLYHDIAPAQCPCGAKAKFNTFVKGYRTYCSARCTAKDQDHTAKMQKVWSSKDADTKQRERLKRDQTNLERYGDTNPARTAAVREKMRQTNLDRYGAEYALLSEEIQQKISQTNLIKYGVERPFQSKEIREKSHATQTERYGPDYMRFARDAFAKKNNNKNPFEVPEIQDKIKQTLTTKYGVEHPMQDPTIQQKSRATLYANHGRLNPAQLQLSDQAYQFLQDRDRFEQELGISSVSEICEKYQIFRERIYAYHNHHGLDILAKRSRSRIEDEVAGVLDNLGVEYQRNYSKLCYPKHVDFFLPKHALAIEFNGLYWHSERAGHKDRHYHSDKTQQCLRENVQLLTIFEDEWKNRPETIKNHIRHLCGKTKQVLGARKVAIANEPYALEIQQFMEKHHIQGKTEGVSIALVGRHDKEIVSVFLLRKTRDHIYDITRYCVDTNYSIPGMFSKFIAFLKSSNTGVKELTTIADLRWSRGDLYLKTGFVLDGHISPDYQYTDYAQREHKFNYRKNKIKSRFGVCIEGKTERELMQELGFDRIWDCGKLRFKKLL
jgi:hypothetical protein